MQPPVLPVRSQLTEAQVVALIEDTGVRFASGAELLTGLDLGVAEDFAGDLKGGSVSRASYANLHASAQLTIARELPWAEAIIRPYITVTDGTDTARFNLGAYYTSTPASALLGFPVVHDVQCYDLLSILDDPVGDAYAVAAGTGYLDAVENILLSLGVVRYAIDQSAAAIVLPTDRTWVFEDRLTWLSIINDLLSSVGYAGIWTDWDGLMRCEQYITPRERGPEWVYGSDQRNTLLGERSSLRDFYNTPNKWVFVQSNILDGAAPVEGAGKYTYTNDFAGDSSVEGRGRTITRVVRIDAADQASLVSAAQRTIDADMQVPTKLVVSTFPNPMHWHFDILYLDDSYFGMPTAAMATQWTLPLDGSNQTHEWTVIE